MLKPKLLYYELGPKVTAFSTTRHGGCSKGRHGSFNINHYCGDDEADITRNLAALKEMIGVEQVILPHQTHGTEVRLVTHQQPAKGWKEELEGVDAVMTADTGICIGVSTADCIPILLYDEVHHAAAAVHAGWRGTVKRIVKKAVESMNDAFGTKASELKAVIGPGISLDAFEVGDEVYEQFLEAGFPMDKNALRYPVKSVPQGVSVSSIHQHPSPNIHHPNSKWHIDLPRCNFLQLQEAGVSQIEMTGICTYQQSEDFFSARKLTVDSGRIYTAIVLR